jgi:hypothetical protein
MLQGESRIDASIVPRHRAPRASIFGTPEFAA